MSKAIIIGAGAQGIVINWVLTHTDDVEKVTLGDISLERMKSIQETNKSSKIKIKNLDASDKDAIVQAIKESDADIAINATIPEFNDPIISACYETGIKYLDMASNGIFPGGDINIPVEQLKYAKKWEEAKLQALILAGSDAGTVNVMAKEGAEELDEVDSIKIKDYAITESEKPMVLWQPETYLKDLSMPAHYWDNGYKKALPFTGEEEYDFPPPINGKGKVYYHSHEESVTIPKFLGKPVKYVDFKMGEPAILFWKSIYDLGLLSGEPIEVKGFKVAPRDILFKLLPPTPTAAELVELLQSGQLESRLMLTVDVYGKKAGRNIRCQMWTDSPDAKTASEKIPGASDISFSTAVAASIFSLMLLRGQVKHIGIFPTEVFDKEERETYFKEIGKWGIKIHKKIIELQ